MATFCAPALAHYLHSLDSFPPPPSKGKPVAPLPSHYPAAGRRPAAPRHLLPPLPQGGLRNWKLTPYGAKWADCPLRVAAVPGLVPSRSRGEAPPHQAPRRVTSGAEGPWPTPQAKPPLGDQAGGGGAVASTDLR